MKNRYRVYHHMVGNESTGGVKVKCRGFTVIEADSEVEAREKIESDYRYFPITISKIILLGDKQMF